MNLIDEYLQQVTPPQELTAAQVWDQRVSFAFGNVSIGNPNVTMEMVIERAVEIYGPRPPNEEVGKSEG